MVALNAMQGAKLLSKWNESPNTAFKFVSPNNDIRSRRKTLKKMLLSTASCLASAKLINIMLEI